MLEKIILAEPRGFCAGVDMAILALDTALRELGKPIYMNHPVVHNEHVVEGFKNRGVIFVEDLRDIPEGSVVLFSAHGSPDALGEEAKNYGLVPVDTVCPLVNKVHKQTQRFRDNGYTTIYIGKNGHPETVATMSYDDNTMLVENVEDAQNVQVEDPDKIAYLTQTTLSVAKTGKIVEALKQRFPNIESSKKEDICYATDNRQMAVRQMAEEADLVLVVGSESSSNSKNLVNAVEGTPAYLVPDVDSIEYGWFDGVKVVGLTSGASVPEELFNSVVEDISKRFSLDKSNIESRMYLSKEAMQQENTMFPIPKALKNLIAAKKA